MGKGDPKFEDTIATCCSNIGVHQIAIAELVAIEQNASSGNLRELKVFAALSCKHKIRKGSVQLCDTGLDESLYP